MELFIPKRFSFKSMNQCVGKITLKLGEMVKTLEGKKCGQVSFSSWFMVESGNEKTLKVPQVQLKVEIKKKSGFKEDDFEFMKLLGKGRYGRVWQCQEKSTGKIYAIKVIRKQDLKDSNKEVRNILVERLILASIKHPFIISLKFAFQNEKKIFFGSHNFSIFHFFWCLSDFSEKGWIMSVGETCTSTCTPRDTSIRMKRW